MRTILVRQSNTVRAEPVEARRHALRPAQGERKMVAGLIATVLMAAGLVGCTSPSYYASERFDNLRATWTQCERDYRAWSEGLVSCMEKANAAAWGAWADSSSAQDARDELNYRRALTAQIQAGEISQTQAQVKLLEYVRQIKQVAATRAPSDGPAPNRPINCFTTISGGVSCPSF